MDCRTPGKAVNERSRLCNKTLAPLQQASGARHVPAAAKRDGPAPSRLDCDRPKGVHIGQGRPRRNQTAKRAEHREAVMRLQHPARIDPVRGRIPLETGADNCPGSGPGPVDAIGVGRRCVQHLGGRARQPCARFLRNIGQVVMRRGVRHGRPRRDRLGIITRHLGNRELPRRLAGMAPVIIAAVFVACAVAGPWPPGTGAAVRPRWRSSQAD